MSNVTAAQAKEDIRVLYRTWTRSVGAVKDRSFLDRHLGEGWWYVDYNGVERGKDEYLELIETVASYEQDMRSLDARIVGDDMALVRGVYHARAELKSGVKLDNVIIFSAVWQLRDGVWKALLHHTTKTPAADAGLPQ